MKYKSIKNLVGNTPLAQIVLKVNGVYKTIFAKLEWYNFSGSIKDRVAYYILTKSIQKGILKKGQKIVEVTSGNTGISICAFGNLFGFETEILMPENMSEERKKLMKSFGANLRLVNDKESSFLKALELSKKYENAFLPSQFENKLNVQAHYKTTANEILKTYYQNKFTINSFVAGVGTGGTLIGCAKRLKENILDLSVFAVEPKSSPTLRIGKKIGSHKIEGISDDFVPALYNKNLVDGIIDVSDEEAIFYAQILSNKLGMGVGISSGANFAGCLKARGNCVTVFSDDNKKYLSTTLLEKSTFVPKEKIEFIELKIFK